VFGRAREVIYCILILLLFWLCQLLCPEIDDVYH
jgi:hypothetical protein